MNMFTNQDVTFYDCRLKYSQLYIARYPFNIARYIMLKHPKEKANPKR